MEINAFRLRDLDYERKMEKIVDRFFSKRVSYYSTPRLRIEEEELFKKYLKKKGKILDMFCGAGRVAIPLAKKGFEVIGVDRNKKMIDAANMFKRKYHISKCKFYCTDALKFEFKKKSFDYALMMENSLEHVPTKTKREKILKKVNNLLHSDGLLITSFQSCFYPPKIFFKLLVRNISSLIKKTEFNDLIIKTKIGPIFLHFFTPFEIEHLLKKTGFKKLAVISFNELNKKRNRFKNLQIYHLFKPLLYNFYIAKKIRDVC